MSIEALLSNFDRLIRTPESVQRLRRFILDLAVRGKLVPQDPDDEPASELLKRIAKEKKRLEKAGKIRKQRMSPSLTEDASPFPLPPNWQWSQIAEIGLLSPRNEAADDLPASFIPMPMIPAEYGALCSHEVRQWADIKRGYTHFAEGDVGLAKITPCFQNSKSTVFRNLTGRMGSGTTELHTVRPLFVDPDFVVLFLKSPYFIETGIPKMTGTAGQKRVPAEYFAHSPFPLPPLDEQRRIVAKVDELMGLCTKLEVTQRERETTRNRLAPASLAHLNVPDPDEARFQEHAKFALDNFASLTARPEQVKMLRHTILNLAVQGKLVPQDPADKPAAELLKLIQIEKASLIKLRRIKTDKHSCPAVRDGLNFSLKPGWISVRLRQILLELQTGPFGSSLHQSDYEKAGTPVVNPASIQNGRIVPIEKMAVGSTTLERLAAFRLRQRDIVMSRRGEMGRCAKVTEREDGWLCGTGSLILRLPKCIYSCFLVILLGSPYVREYLNGSAVGATMQNLNQSILLNLVIGLPPLAEQQRIVAKVDKLMRLCDRLERSVETEDHKRTLLVEALLCRSVSNPGIVPSDRSDSNALRNAVQGHELEAT